MPVALAVPGADAFLLRRFSTLSILSPVSTKPSDAIRKGRPCLCHCWRPSPIDGMRLAQRCVSLSGTREVQALRQSHPTQPAHPKENDT